MQKTWQITRHKLSNNTQWYKHVLRVHNVTNKTYKHSQVFETQTRYTREMVWQEFHSNDSDNIGNNDSDTSD